MSRQHIWQVAVALTVILTVAARAEETWRSLGPDGGSVNALAVDPRDGRVLLAATAVGLFRSANSGHSWSPFGTGLPGWVSEVAFDPFDPRHLLAATTGGVYRSNDSGSTWVASSAGLPTGFYALQVRALPGRRGVWLALGAQTCGAFSLLARSTDGGATWTVIHRGLPDNVQWDDARPDPFNVNLVYLASNDGLYRSRDGGRSWQRRSLAGRLVSGVLLDLFRPGRLWVVATNPTGTKSQALVSMDGGLHWQEKRSLPFQGTGFYAPALAADPARRDHLYFATTAGLLLTRDGGQTWRQVFAGWVTTLVGDRSTATLTAGGFNSDFGVARSQNGVNWVTFRDGLRTNAITHVATGGGAAIWAAGVARTWVSQDDGDGWAGSSPGMTGAIAADPVSPLIAYSGGNGLFRTRDGGATWEFAGPSSLTPRPYKDVFGLALDSQSPARLYLLDRSGLYRSDDGADSWQVLWPAGPRDPLGVGGLALGAGSPPILLAGRGQYLQGHLSTSILRSTDSGATWTTVTTVPGAASAIVADRSNAQRLWVATPGEAFCGYGAPGGVFRSADGGGTWVQSSVGPSSSLVSSLILNPSDPDELFAGTTTGVYVSHDAGASWQALPSGIPPGSVTGLALRQGASDTLFAATAGGVYALTLP